MARDDGLRLPMGLLSRNDGEVAAIVPALQDAGGVILRGASVRGAP